ncbi:MAG: hypothetical protein OEV64_06145 [Desulfobulbaceae bacterium]|nr:hypothetical protein [Desulfobulbaceae bacterium]
MLCQLEDWRTFIKEGEEYLATADSAFRKRSPAFTPEILYNISAMAIEKLLMGFLMFHNDLADNHTMADLISSVERHVSLKQGLKEDLLFIDSFQKICDPYHSTYKAPNREDIEKNISIAHCIRDFNEMHISEFVI